MKTRRLMLEILEERCLPSSTVVPTAMLWSDFGAIPDSGPVTNKNVVGYTPVQIRAAYGFDQTPSLVTNGYNTAGQGQIIAIVDAYDDPNIGDDLKAFDKQFGIPDPTFI